MKKRTTENTKHIFQDKLYRKLNAYELQGLTMKADRTAFIAGVEYFDLDQDEYLKIKRDASLLYKNVFLGMNSFDVIKAQAIFTNKLGVELYYLWGYDDQFLLHEIGLDNKGDCTIKNDWWINTEQVISFWRTIKGTVQTHAINLNGAAQRASQTRIDGILQANGLEWGGNIDGFILEDEEVVAIIDCISIGPASQKTTHDLTDVAADPALYFLKRGPRYETWLSTVLVADTLNVPHLLFTLDKVHPDCETIGLAAISALSRAGINYINNVAPNQNVLFGMEKILIDISNLIGLLKPPVIRD